ncbi:MAG: S-layer homology domain-containing protein [candidate division SR1 bacterium]|nr:S-layer homology domain-containing protein [candidate division SR1 bacterium]
MSRVSANSLEYLLDETFFTGSYVPGLYVNADLHFNRGGNDFGGKIFFQSGVKNVGITTISLNVPAPPFAVKAVLDEYSDKQCNKQVRGFYINSARGNRVRPLDQDSLTYLQSVDSSYDSLTMTGGFFVCSTPATAVYGYIQHTRSGENYYLVAGMQYDFDHNQYIHLFDINGSLLFENGTTRGYLRDSYGGIAEVSGSGSVITYVCGDGLVEESELCDDGVNNGKLHYCNATCNGIVACDADEIEVAGVCTEGLPVPNIFTGNTSISGSALFEGYTSTGVVLGGTGTLIIVSDDGSNSIEIPATLGAILASGLAWDGDLAAPQITGVLTLAEIARDLPTNTSTTTYSHDIVTTIKVGSNESDLRPRTGFFTINLAMDPAYNGQTLTIYRSEDTETWIKNEPGESCFVQNNICSFTTNHLSFFAPVRLVTTTKTTGSNGGGGGGGGGAGNICASIHCATQNSPLCCSSQEQVKLGDTKIEKLLAAQIALGIHGSAPTCSVTDSPYSAELTSGFSFAYSVGITSQCPITKANLDGVLLRKHAAKMISQFAVSVLGKKPNNLAVCNFTDMTGETPEMNYYADLACKLGLMGLKSDGTPDTIFNPSGQVTRAQFGTMLSRLLYGNANNAKPGKRYTAHLNALKAAGIMTKITQPAMLELRGFVMIMMERISSK